MAVDLSKVSGFANGWFVVAFSDELAVGGVQPIRYFASDLVLFRTESGAATILDAHCPHMGAHFGYDSVVKGERIECPFHAWQFGRDGKCAHIPYQDEIPRKARVRSWPTAELNGLIFVWHHREGAAPTWQIPTIDEHNADGWTDWSHSRMDIKTHPREIIENVADKQHFPRVHRTNITRFENVFEDHKATQLAEGIAYPRPGQVDNFKITATYFGPGYQVSWMHGVLSSVLVNAHTPIDDNLLHLRFGVMIRDTGSAKRNEQFAGGYIENLTKGFLEDVSIWEHKVYRTSPLLLKNDGPIGKVRRWYGQFYE